MRLDCEEQPPVQNVTEVDLRIAFANDAERGEFVILSEADEVYIQAAGEGDGPYTLEYRDGGHDRHYECTYQLDKAMVEWVFLKYLRHDETWRTQLEWRRLETSQSKPRWRFW
jgi:hypothetical protein